MLAGMTDYTGVALEDILGHLRQWRKHTAEVVDYYRDAPAKVDDIATKLEMERDARQFAALSLDLFQRYLADFDRLLEELPRGVREAHVEILVQLVRGIEPAVDLCIAFSNRQINRPLQHEEIRPFLDRLYAEAEAQLEDYRDLSNVVPRLKTYVGSDGDRSVRGLGDALELSPNFFGFGVNLKKLISWVRSRFVPLRRKR